MRPQKIGLCLIGFVLCILSSLLWAQGTCTITKRGELPIEEVGGRFVIAAKINHQPVMMLIDSGASHGALEPGLGEALMLSEQQNKTVNISGLGGKISTHPYVASLFEVGPVTQFNYDINLANIGTPETANNPKAPVGLIGTDTLSRHDLEFDFPNKVLRFYDVSHCSGRFIPWTGEYQDVHAFTMGRHLFIIPVGINGNVVHALVDTGSRQTSLGQSTVNKAHLSDDQKTGKTMQFYGSSGTTIAKQYKLDSFVVGRSKFSNVPVYVQPESYGQFDMLLGMDFMKWRKVWLSYKTEQVFMQFTPQRGPLTHRYTNCYSFV
jgi:clan AA aspartic protease (TIGR02281 family)